MPFNPEVNDFLQRFIATSGPGPHHMTFKVPHLLTAVDHARRSGYEPIGIDLSDPEWLEAFIHPRQATGVVVQLAEAPNPWHGPAPEDYPGGHRQRRDGSGPVSAAALVRVVHAVADLAVASALFVDLLGGTVLDRGTRSDHRWMDLDWGGPLGLRLVSPVDAPPDESLARWLGDRSGRVHHLELVAEEPETVPDARPGDPTVTGLDIGRVDGTYRVVEPGSNAGLRLVIHTP
jgi:methylmalonyl-CoA/ethylmalonyl-CoA epimerase